jgi:hypothetical protein
MVLMYVKKAFGYEFNSEPGESEDLAVRRGAASGTRDQLCSKYPLRNIVMIIRVRQPG